MLLAQVMTVETRTKMRGLMIFVPPSCASFLAVSVASSMPAAESTMLKMTTSASSKAASSASALVFSIASETHSGFSLSGSWR